MAWSKIYSLSQHECMHAVTCTVARKHTHTHTYTCTHTHAFTHTLVYVYV